MSKCSEKEFVTHILCQAACIVIFLHEVEWNALIQHPQFRHRNTENQLFNGTMTFHRWCRWDLARRTQKPKLSPSTGWPMPWRSLDLQSKWWHNNNSLMLLIAQKWLSLGCYAVSSTLLLYGVVLSISVAPIWYICRLTYGRDCTMFKTH